MVQPFVLNNESRKNSYGFRIPNKGINLSRFLQNPVMLDQHLNSTSAVIGRWSSVTLTGSTLTALPEFDTEDADANKIKGKVERGFIKGASMGVIFDPRKMKLAADGVPELTECELYEASIVAVPSNADALRLYAADTGELLTEDQVKLSLSALTNNLNINPTKMEKLVLSAACLVALGLQNADDVAAVGAAVTTLAANYEKEKTLRVAAETKLNNQTLALAASLVDDAIVAGKITADLRESYLSFAKADYESAVKVIAKLPGKQTLGATHNSNEGAGEVKTAEDFQKLSHEQQLAFKREHPDTYKKLFAQ